jgi:hypothetical protein
MRRKNDAHKDEVEGVAQRLRSERPEASPLELDRIKTSAMSRAKAGTRRGRAGARRLATASLTVGLLAAGTGGVIAGVATSGIHGNAATAQYGSNCDVGNNVGNNIDNEGGNENNNGNNNGNCNHNSFNGNTTNSNNTTEITNTTTINATTVTVSATPAASSVLGSTTSKAKTGKIKIHVRIPRKSKVKKVTLKLNGKRYAVISGKKASSTFNLTNLPCGTEKLQITVTLTSGKVITQQHTYKLC